MSTHAPAPAAPAPSRFWLVVTALVAAELTCALASNMIFVALSRLFQIYGDPVHVTWLITAFSLTSAASAAVCSRLGDIFGRRRVLLIMLGVALAGSLLSGLASDLNVIILGRALQGASMAILPLAFGILREHASERQLNVGVGMLGGTYSFGVGLGAILGGFIVDHGAWQRMFLVSAGTALFALLMVVLIIPPGAKRPQKGSLDLIGGGLFVVPIAALLLALTNGKAWGWNTPVPWVLLVGGLVGLAVWLRHELRQPSPLIDVRLLRVPQIAIVNVVLFLTMLGPSLYPQVLLPLWQQPVWTGIGLGVSATLAGVLKLPTNLSSGASAILAGFIARAFGMRIVVIAASFLMLASWALLALSHSSIWFMVAVVVLLLSPALTILYGCAPGLIIEASPEERTSETTGLTQVIRAIGMSIGSQVVAFTLATSFISNGAGARFPDERAYLTTFVTMIALSLATTLVAMAIPRRRPRAAEQMLRAAAE